MFYKKIYNIYLPISFRKRSMKVFFFRSITISVTHRVTGCMWSGSKATKTRPGSSQSFLHSQTTWILRKTSGTIQANSPLSLLQPLLLSFLPLPHVIYNKLELLSSLFRRQFLAPLCLEYYLHILDFFGGWMMKVFFRCFPFFHGATLCRLTQSR